jgi:mevalonate kinase
MKKRVEVSAPGKLMLFGEHAVVYGRPCIVTAVDQRMRVLVEASGDKKLRIEAPSVGLSDYSLEVSELNRKQDLPKGARFVVMAVYNFFDKFSVKSGLKIKTESELSSEFGFGSSSAVTVAVTKALAELFNIKLDNKELFELSYKTVLDVQGVGSGFDLAAAIWGGTLWFVTGGKTIIPLKTEKLPIVVGYMGIKADTPTLVRQVAEKQKAHTEITTKIFEVISLIVHEAKRTLEERNWLVLGELMNLNQGLLDALEVNTRELSSLIYVAREARAFGAKLSGAGGGDCMIALISEENRRNVEIAIEKEGGKILYVKTGAEGTRVI